MWAEHEDSLRNTGTNFSTRMTKRNGFNKETFILSVDVGTTSIRCHIYDKEAQIRGSCITKVFISFYIYTHLSDHLEADLCVFMYLCIMHLSLVVLVIFHPGCSPVSRGRTCWDGPRCAVDGVHHCGQGSCARYLCGLTSELEGLARMWFIFHVHWHSVLHMQNWWRAAHLAIHDIKMSILLFFFPATHPIGSTAVNNSVINNNNILYIIGD